MFTRLLARLASALLGIFIFTRCIPNTLDICLRWLLSRFRSGQSRGVHSWGLLRNLLFEWAARVSPPEFFGGLCSCCQVFVIVRSSGGFVGLLLVPSFPVLRDSPKFSDGLPCDCKRCPRKSCPCLLLSSSRDEEGLIGFSSLLSDGITSMAIFPQILWGKRDQNRGNRRKVSTVLRIKSFPTYHVTQWLCSEYHVVICTEFANCRTLRAIGMELGDIKTKLEVAVQTKWCKFRYVHLRAFLIRALFLIRNPSPQSCEVVAKYVTVLNVRHIWSLCFSVEIWYLLTDLIYCHVDRDASLSVLYYSSTIIGAI